MIFRCEVGRVCPGAPSLRFLALVSALAFCFCVSGCSSYALRGRVVAGARASVEVVSVDDPRLTRERGVADAELKLTLDPERLSREVVARGHSGSDGGFALPVGVVGAGVLMHEVALEARREGYGLSSGVFDLPGKGWRVLVTVVVGKAQAVDERSLIEQTLDDAEPFLRP